MHSVKKTDRLEICIIAVLVTGVAFGVVSFFLPPTGQIDPSVLRYIALCMGCAALMMGLYAIKRGFDARFTHGETTIELNNPDNNEDDQRDRRNRRETAIRDGIQPDDGGDMEG